MFGVGYVGIVRTTLLADTAQFDSAMMGASRSFKRAAHDIRREAQSLFSMSAGMNLAITVPFALATRSMVKAGAEYEASMMKIRQIARLSTNDMKALNKEMLAISKYTRTSPNELARIGYLAGQAQILSPAAIAKFQRSIAKAQVVLPGDAPTDTVAEGMLSNLKAFGIGQQDFEKTMAEMVKTIDLGRISWESYSKTIQQVAAVAASMPGDGQFKKMNIALALATQGGVGGPEAATALRNLYLRIYQRSAVGSSELNATAQTLGFKNAAQMFEQGVNADISEFMHMLSKTGINTPEAATNAGFMKREVTTALQLMNAPFGELDRYREEYDASLQDFQERYKDALNSPINIMKGVAAAGQRVKLSFFAAVGKPLMRVLEFIEGMLNKFSAMSDFKKQLLFFAGAIASLGVVISTIVGFVKMVMVGGAIRNILQGGELGGFDRSVLLRIHRLQKGYRRAGEMEFATPTKALRQAASTTKSHLAGGVSVRGLTGLSSIITKLTTTLVKTNHLLAQILRQCCKGMKGVGARRTRASRYPIVPYGYEGGMSLYNGAINPEVLPPESSFARSRARGLLGGRRMLPWNIKNVAGMSFVGDPYQISDPARLLGMGQSGAKGASRPASLRSLIQQMINALRNLTPKITTLTSAIGKLTLAANKLATLITRVFLKPTRSRGGAADGMNWRFYGNRDNIQGRAYNPRFDGMQYPPAMRQQYSRSRWGWRHTPTGRWSSSSDVFRWWSQQIKSGSTDFNLPNYLGPVKHGFGHLPVRLKRTLRLGAPNETGFDMPYYSGAQGKAYGRPPTRLNRTLRLGMYPMGGALMLGGGGYPARVGAGSFVGGASGPFLLGAGSGYPLGMPGAKDITGDARVGSPYGAQGLLGASGGRSRRRPWYNRADFRAHSLGSGDGASTPAVKGRSLFGALGKSEIGGMVAMSLKFMAVMAIIDVLWRGLSDLLAVTFVPALNNMLSIFGAGGSTFQNLGEIFQFIYTWAARSVAILGGTVLGTLENVIGSIVGVVMIMSSIVSLFFSQMKDGLMFVVNSIRNSWIGRRLGWDMTEEEQAQYKSEREQLRENQLMAITEWAKYAGTQFGGIFGGEGSAVKRNMYALADLWYGTKGDGATTGNYNPQKSNKSLAGVGLADSVTVGGSSGLFEAGTLAAYEAVVKANSAVVDAIAELRVQTIGRLDTIGESLDNLIDANSGVTMEYQ